MFATSTSGVSGTGSAADQDVSELDRLKLEIETLANEVSRIVEERTRRARHAAQAGVDAARDGVAEYPLASIAVAFAAGAAIGLIVTSPPRRVRSNFGDDIKGDLANYANQLRSSLAQNVRDVRESSIVDRLERVASALSATDAKETMAPVIDRVAGWFGQAKAAAQTAAT